MSSTESIPGPVDEAVRILNAAEKEGLRLRLAGGVAIALTCPSARRPPLRRNYQDIDFVTYETRYVIERLFSHLGYVPDTEFNAINGQERLVFVDVRNARHADVFVGRIRMCHDLDLRERLDLRMRTLTPADLLLSKLQIVETNDKDHLDVIALLSDQRLTTDESGINVKYVADLCSSDWGWWRTATMVAERTETFAREVMSLNGSSDITAKIRTIISELDSAPKSRKWKLRARIGERVRWYDVPEEVEP